MRRVFRSLCFLQHHRISWGVNYQETTAAKNPTIDLQRSAQ